MNDQRTAEHPTPGVMTRLLRSRRGRKLPHWHGTCSLDHWSAADADRCTRTD
jgi:hypothetical protein